MTPLLDLLIEHDQVMAKIRNTLADSANFPSATDRNDRYFFVQRQLTRWKESLEENRLKEK